MHCLPGIRKHLLCFRCCDILSWHKLSVHKGEPSPVDSNLRIILRHLLPNCIPTLIITITMGIPSAILSEASLSFLGLGVRAPMSSWGDMISASRAFMGSDGSKWFYSFFPGLCMIVAVIAFNTLGDGLRDALDPKLRK